MPNTARLTKPKRTTINIESDLHKAGVAKAKALGLTGGFSEYLARLISRDSQRKGSAASGVSRHLRKARE